MERVRALVHNSLPHAQKLSGPATVNPSNHCSLLTCPGFQVAKGPWSVASFMCGSESADHDPHVVKPGCAATAPRGHGPGPGGCLAVHYIRIVAPHAGMWGLRQIVPHRAEHGGELSVWIMPRTAPPASGTWSADSSGYKSLSEQPTWPTGCSAAGQITVNLTTAEGAYRWRKTSPPLVKRHLPLDVLSTFTMGSVGPGPMMYVARCPDAMQT